MTECGQGQRGAHVVHEAVLFNVGRSVREDSIRRSAVHLKRDPTPGDDSKKEKCFCNILKYIKVTLFLQISDNLTG